MNQISNNKEIKILLFDLEGVLIPKNSPENLLLLERYFKVVESYFKHLNSLGYTCGVITLRSEDSVIMQFKKIPQCIVITSMFDKVTPVENLLRELNLNFEQLFYIGDDMFDIPLLNKAGVSAAPSNAHREVKRIVDLIIPYAMVEDLFEFILKEVIKKEIEL
jgi:3-deoxy-D-manno-octulosonate 8-phosphate phosphatase (KDO 8-P phosphatase)